MTRLIHLAGRSRRPSPAWRAALLLVCALVASPTSAQLHSPPAPPPLQLSEYQKQDWQVEDGLPENNIRMIAQQPNGSLLLATGAGLATFDGQHFSPLPVERGRPIQNEAVNAVLYGPHHDLWIGTDGRGVLRQTAQGLVDISELAGRYNERIRMLAFDSTGALWIATQNGIERFANDRLEIVSGAGMISGDITTPFAEDGFGGMFFLTSSGLYRWMAGAIERYPLRTGSSDLPVAVYRDPQQRIWVGTMKHLVQLTPAPLAQRQSGHAALFVQTVRAAVANPVTVLLGDAQGNLWIGTRHTGLWRLNATGFSHWGVHDGLADDSIRSLFLDDEQNLWIGMLAGGLSRWREGPLAPFGLPEGFNAAYAANTLADSHGDLWLGTWGKGLFRRHKGSLQPFTLPGMSLSTPIRALAEDRKGSIWIGTWFNGVYRYDGQTVRHYLLGTESPGNAVSAILADKHGGLWIGTYMGLFYFPGGQADPGKGLRLLDAQLITCMLEDRDGSILVGTVNKLYRIRGGNDLTQVQNFPLTHVLSLFLDSMGYAWVTTKAGGLMVIRSNGVEPMPRNSGLPGYSIDTAIEDRDRHLWMGTSRGILRVSVPEMHAVVDGLQPRLSSVILGKADGMRSSECSGPSEPSSTRSADGTLWFATAKGFVHTTDDAEKLGTVKPAAMIAGWAPLIDSSASDMRDPNTPVVLEPGQTELVISYNAKFLANPDAVEYRYQMVGYDQDWTSTHGHNARYRRLPPGNYRFQVQARFSGEQWSSPVASMAVRQRPYFYRTWYFYLALCLVIAAAVALLFHRRVQTIKGHIGIVLEERNRIARDCHDTLMAGFAAISWQLEATAKLFQQENDEEKEQTQAAHSFDLARSMVTHCQAEARRIIWDLRDLEDVTSLLSQALRRTLLSHQINDDIQTSFEVEGDELPLAPGCVHHLLCIGQEAYFNAIRHASPSRIAVHLRYENDALHLSIRDNGCGMRQDRRHGSGHGHFGIAVMQERARKLGGTLKVHSSEGAGTEVLVRVAFQSVVRSAPSDYSAVRVNGL